MTENSLNNTIRNFLNIQTGKNTEQFMQILRGNFRIERVKLHLNTKDCADMKPCHWRILNSYPLHRLPMKNVICICGFPMRFFLKD